MTAWIVMLKEIIDNLRDRQTVFYALLFGPVLLPLTLGGSLMAALSQLSIDFDEVSSLAMMDVEAAPNLVAFLRAQNIDVHPAPEAPLLAIREGDIPVVLEILPDYEQALRDGRPAPLILHLNEADKDSAQAARRISALLGAYERTLDNLRLQVRGIDPKLFDSLDLQQNDVSEDGAGGQLLASVLPFLLIISMVMGGFYLAIDTTAGERERSSLEPLLSLPIPRRHLVFGKYGATLCFVALSGCLTVLTLYVLYRLFPDTLSAAGINFDGHTLVRAALLAAPLTLFIAAMLMTVSAYTRSTKEAQTYLGLLMIIPMTPFFLLQFGSLRAGAVGYWLPMLSQYQLLERVVLDDPLSRTQIGYSVLGTMTGAALLLWLAVRLYSRERLLR